MPVSTGHPSRRIRLTRWCHRLHRRTACRCHPVCLVLSRCHHLRRGSRPQVHRKGTQPCQERQRLHHRQLCRCPNHRKQRPSLSRPRSRHRRHHHQCSHQKSDCSRERN